MTTPRDEPRASHLFGPWWTGLKVVARGVHIVVLLGAVALLVGIGGLFVRAAPQRAPRPVPPAMESVDWSAPESSVFCLACHRQVAPAMAGLDVQRGHSQNVPLGDVQLAAIREMGTVVGPDNTLICMSCHHLGPDAGPYMLADTLEDSRLCQRCHPGHYARGTPHDLRLSAPGERNRLGQTVAEGGPCSACHLSHRFAREIVPSPLDPDGYCITCHQAYHVAEHLARTPMHHPESHCLQCHDPHDTGHGNFLRAEVNDLCLRCHAQMDGGVAAGMHPLGAMDRPIPVALGGGPQAAATNEVTCITCHAMHDAGYPKLLRMPYDSNAFCLTCHREQLEARTHDGSLPRHGQGPVLDDGQRVTVAAWGRPAGPEGELLCVSCHRVHGAAPAASLLAGGPRSDDTCMACHPGMRSVVGSVHDLRFNHPLEKNVRGDTAVAAGACSACHLGHGPARPIVPGPGDPRGQCVSCHQAGQCAGAKVPGAATHPETTCVDCHNPHERRSGKFLFEDSAALCLRCHAAQASMLGGPHDISVTVDADAWPPAAHGKADVCLPCHLPHGGEPGGLYRFPGPVGFGTHDGSCLECHLDAAWGASTSVPAAHPRNITPEHAMFDLALVPADEHGNKRIGCRTCHDAHGAAHPPYLARLGPGQTTEDLCLQCHAQMRAPSFSGHSSVRLAAEGHITDACKPCHVMHVDERTHSGVLLSTRFLHRQGDPLAAATRQGIPCEQCHRAPGLVSPRMLVQHPEVITWNMIPPEDPAYMPLFGPDGKVNPRGQVTCRTCHISHGRMDLIQRMEAGHELTDTERAAMKTHVRPFEPTNICTICHGPVARMLFLFFHEPDRRPPARPNVAR